MISRVKTKHYDVTMQLNIMTSLRNSYTNYDVTIKTISRGKITTVSDGMERIHKSSEENVDSTLKNIISLHKQLTDTHHVVSAVEKAVSSVSERLPRNVLDESDVAVQGPIQSRHGESRVQRGKYRTNTLPKILSPVLPQLPRIKERKSLKHTPNAKYAKYPLTKQSNENTDLMKNRNKIKNKVFTDQKTAENGEGNLKQKNETEQSKTHSVTDCSVSSPKNESPIPKVNRRDKTNICYSSTTCTKDGRNLVDKGDIAELFKMLDAHLLAADLFKKSRMQNSHGERDFIRNNAPMNNCLLPDKILCEGCKGNSMTSTTVESNTPRNLGSCNKTRNHTSIDDKKLCKEITFPKPIICKRCQQEDCFAGLCENKNPNSFDSSFCSRNQPNSLYFENVKLRNIPMYPHAVLCNGCRNSECCREVSVEGKSDQGCKTEETKKNDSKENVRLKATENTQKYLRDNAINSICVKMNIVPKCSSADSKSGTLKNQERVNKSTNAKQTRWRDPVSSDVGDLREIHIVLKQDSIPKTAGDKEIPRNKKGKKKSKEGKTKPVKTKSMNKSESPSFGFKNVLVELPPIPNDLKDFPKVTENDLCGWLPRISADASPFSAREDRKVGNDQPVRKGEQKTWFTPETENEQKMCFVPPHKENERYCMHGNRKLPHLYDSSTSKFKSKHKIDDAHIAAAEAEDAGDDNNDTSSLDFGAADLEGSHVRSNLITMDPNPVVQNNKRRSKEPKLPPLKCTSVSIESKKIVHAHTKSSRRSRKGIDTMVVENMKQTENLSEPIKTPVIDIIKALPVKQPKKSEQMVNWCKKNVTPVKLPPLDLALLDQAPNDTTHKQTVVADYLYTSPKVYNSMYTGEEIRKSARERQEEMKRNIEPCTTPNRPNIRQLLRVFDKPKQKVLDMPVCMIGNKVEVNPMYHPHERGPISLPKPKYREKADVPPDIVRLALRYQPTHYGQIGGAVKDKNYTNAKLKPRTKEKIYDNDQLEKELERVRAELREKIRAPCTRTHEVYSKFGTDNSLSNRTDTHRSGIARPCSPSFVDWN